MKPTDHGSQGCLRICPKGIIPGGRFRNTYRPRKRDSLHLTTGEQAETTVTDILFTEHVNYEYGCFCLPGSQNRNVRS